MWKNDPPTEAVPRGLRFPFAVIFLASFSLVALEIVWTRIFSAEFFYTLAFLVLSMAIQGLGLGGLALRLVPRLREPKRLGPYLVLTAILSLAGPPLVVQLGRDLEKVLSYGAIFGRLVATILILGSALFAGGMALSLPFRTRHPEMAPLPGGPGRRRARRGGRRRADEPGRHAAGGARGRPAGRPRSLPRGNRGRRNRIGPYVKPLRRNSSSICASARQGRGRNLVLPATENRRVTRS